MTRSFLSFTDVSFRYPDSPRALFEGLSLEFPCGWTGIVGPNGAGKTTILLIASGILAATSGSVRSPGDSLYCAQRTDDPPALLSDMLCSPEAGELASRLQIRGDWTERWNTLSHGERKRAQIAVALWRDPPVLCVDEPTNHVDAATRRLLLDGLRRYRGVGLLVSHDRELLDLLCARCLMVEAPGALMRPGSYTEASALDRAEKERLREGLAGAKERERVLRRQVVQKKREVQDARARLSKRHVDPRDHDAKARIDLARLTSKDRTPARLVREMEARRERAHTAAEAISVKKQYELGLWFESERARRDTLFSLPETSLSLGGQRRLVVPALVMLPRDRIALTGPNGAGKSTLLRHIAACVPLPAERMIFMPQEMGGKEESAILAGLHSLGEAEKGRVMTVVNLLGSDPKAVLASARLSPGELRKVLLAMGIARVPHLIVMDEPTNHLDLPSIECLAAALGACACGLLLASHDEQFLAGLTTRRWTIEPGPEGRSALRER